MRDDFTEAELKTIGTMRRMSKSLPDDFLGLAVVQELACVVSAIGGRLTDDELAVLMGAGAYLMRATEAETMAGFRAMIAIQNARNA